MDNRLNRLNTLGLCKRAGRLVAGKDAAIAAVADTRKWAGVLLTKDLSDKSKKEMAFQCDKHKRRLSEIDYTMEEVQSILGRKTGIIAVLDKGFFTALAANLDN